MLSGLGYQVVVAHDGEEAVTLLEQVGSEVQLAILDVTMPKMNGIDAARKMRGLYPRLRVIFLTAYDITRDLPEHL